MKDIYLIENWKMNPVSVKEAQKLAADVSSGIKRIKCKKNLHIGVCPPHTYLASVGKYTGKHINLGAQNCYFEDRGAYTGEVSAKMLKDLGCKFVIVGHSERRRYFKEDNEMINKKIKTILKNNMRPVLAIGEQSRESFDAKGVWSGELDPAIKDQILGALKGIGAAKAKNILIAYEPLWAIGTGHAASTDDVMSVRIFIQKILKDMYSASVMAAIPILYGGSTDPKNISSFLGDGGMNGVLIGGSSLKADTFLDMVAAVNNDGLLIC